MLDSMRRNANSWVFTLLFAIIIFVFAVNFGPWAGRHDSVATYAALVNGHEIGIGQLNAELNRYTRSGITLEQMRSLKMDRRILDSLVESELLAQFAEKNGLVVTDEQLVESINRLLGGKSVSNEDYRKIINSELGMKVEDFESSQRRRMLAFMVTDALVSNIPISDSDLKTNFFIRNDKVAVNYIRIDPSFFDGKDKAAKMEQAQKYAGDIVKELSAGKKLDQISRTELVKKEKGIAPTDKDVAPVYAQTEFFARAGSHFPPAFVDAAFELPRSIAMVDIAEKGVGSPLPFTQVPVAADGKLYVIQYSGRQHPKESDFLKEKDTLRQTLENERKNAIIAGFVDDLKKTANIEYNEALFQEPSREGPIEG